MLQPFDWEAIKNEVFLFEAGCWNGCGGGFCCSQNHPDFDFKLMPKTGTGTTLLYWDREYEYLEKRGKVQPVSEVGKPHKLELNFGGPRPLTITHVPCRHLGLCDGKLDKPLVCKLYPFLPVVGTDGSVEEVLPLSIFDLTFDAIGERSPCWVRMKAKQYLAQWQKPGALPESFHHPLYMLYSQAARHFVDLYMKNEHPRLKGKTGKDFWTTWEFLYLGGRLFDAKELKARVHKTYLDIVAVHGEFMD